VVCYHKYEVEEVVVVDDDAIDPIIIDVSTSRHNYALYTDILHVGNKG